MKISFVAGFGPISPDPQASRRFWVDEMGIELAGDDNHRATDELEGIRAYAVWALSGAAQSCFETDDWPASVPRPQAWIEFDVESTQAVAEAAAELEERGHRLLRPAKEEGWGQTVARLLSPEGLLVGISYTPWMHVQTDSD
ncbi:glyoxalase/bleomycin resistance/dioxygenase family protein [soil metagenome]